MATMKRQVRFKVGDKVRFTTPGRNLWGNEGVRAAFENRTVFTVLELTPISTNLEAEKMIQISINGGYWVNKCNLELVEKRKSIRAWIL